MKPREEMKDWIIEALTDLGGSAAFIDVYKYIWKNYEAVIMSGGDEWILRWQYELSHAASGLRKGPSRRLRDRKHDGCPPGVWALK